MAARVGSRSTGHGIAEKVKISKPFARDMLSTAPTPSLEALEARQLLAFGQADQSFGTGGRVTFPLPVSTTPLVADIEVANGGDIVAGGLDGLVRWDGNGAIDTEFGVNGFAAIGSNGAGDDDLAIVLHRQRDRRDRGRRRHDRDAG